MEDDIRGLLINELISRGHSRKSVDVLIRNLEKDHLLEPIASGLSELKTAHEMISTLRRVNPGLVGEYLPMVEESSWRFYMILDAMMADDHYQKRFLLDRGIMLRRTISEYRDRMEKALAPLEDMIRSASVELRGFLRRAVEPLLGKAEDLLERMDGEKMHPMSLRRELVEIVTDVKDLLSASESLAEGVAGIADRLPVLSERLEKVEEDMDVVLERRQELSKALEGVSSTLRELRKISIDSAMSMLHMDFVSDYVQEKYTLIEELSSKCADAGRDCYDNAMSTANDLESELMATLEDARGVLRLMEVRDLASGSLRKMEGVRSSIDSIIGADLTSEIWSDLTTELNSLVGEKHITSRSDMQELAKEAQKVQNLIDGLSNLSESAKEFSRSESKARGVTDVGERLVRIRSVLQEGDASPFDRLSRVIRMLDDFLREARKAGEVLEDLMRLYPIWKRRVLSLVRNQSSVTFDRLRDVPEKWRRWVARKIADEEEDIVLKGEELAVSGTIGPIFVRLEAIEQKISALESMIGGLEELLGVELSEEETILREMRDKLRDIGASPEMIFLGREQDLDQTLAEMDQSLDTLSVRLREKLSG